MQRTANVHVLFLFEIGIFKTLKTMNIFIYVSYLFTNKKANISLKHDWSLERSCAHSRLDSIRSQLRSARRMFLGAGDNVSALELALEPPLPGARRKRVFPAPPAQARRPMDIIT